MILFSFSLYCLLAYSNSLPCVVIVDVFSYRIFQERFTLKREQVRKVKTETNGKKRKEKYVTFLSTAVEKGKRNDTYIRMKKWTNQRTNERTNDKTHHLRFTIFVVVWVCARIISSKWNILLVILTSLNMCSYSRLTANGPVVVSFVYKIISWRHWVKMMQMLHKFEVYSQTYMFVLMTFF